MHRYYLSTNVSLCALGSHIVILDLPTQKYLALDCRDCPALLRPLCDANVSEDRQLALDAPDLAASAQVIGELRSRGILATSPQTRRSAATPIVAPIKSLVSVPLASSDDMSLEAVIRLFISFATIRFAIRIFGLQHLIERFRKQQERLLRTAAARDLEQVGKTVRLFCRIRPWLYTAHEKCLFDSMVLTDFLHRYGFPVKLVIGVTPTPFSGHAWVQMEDCLIDDTVEAVRKYLPILVT